MVSTTSYHFIKSNYHNNCKCAHITLFNNQFGNSEYSLLDKSLQWMFLLCGKRSFDLWCLSTYWVFFMVGMTTDRVFRAGYTILFFVSLALSLHEHCGCSWTSLCLLESPSFSKMPVNLVQYRGAVGSFNNGHFARELKNRNLSLPSHYHNNIFVHCFFFP